MGARKLPGEFDRELGIIGLGEQEEGGFGVVEMGCKGLPLGEGIFEEIEFFQNALGTGGIVPEIRLLALGAERIGAVFLSRDVKATSEGFRLRPSWRPTESRVRGT